MVDQITFQRLKKLREARAAALVKRRQLANASRKTTHVKSGGSHYSRRVFTVKNLHARLSRTVLPRNFPGYYRLHNKSRGGCKSCGKKIK